MLKMRISCRGCTRSRIVSLIELFAALFGIVSVYLGTRQNVWVWPTGLVNVGLYIFVFFEARLYADMGLQGIYVALCLYGWYHWLHGSDQGTPLLVTRTSRQTMAALGVVAVAATLALGSTLASQTDASLPWLDSATTVVSLVAQWMMTRKLLEHWLVWIGVDTVYVGMFLYKALYVTAGLYLVFLGLAVLGYRNWRRTFAEGPTA